MFRSKIFTILTLFLTVGICLTAVSCSGGTEQQEPNSGPDEVQSDTSKLSAAGYAQRLLAMETPLFSCKVDGVPISERGTERAVAQYDTEDGTAWDVTVTDTASGLCFVTTMLLFDENNALEFSTVIYGPQSGGSPVISRFYSVDLNLPIAGDALEEEESIVLSTARGCLGTGSDDHFDFGQRDYVLEEIEPKTFKPVGGISCNYAWPYFEVAGSDGGAILAIGWTGQWKAEFLSVSEGANVKIGQEYFSAYLMEGERIITPTLTVYLYEGSTDDAINGWRQLYLNYYTPENVLTDDFVFPVSFDVELNDFAVDRIRSLGESFAGVPLYGWMDAGWYGDYGVDKSRALWNDQVGNWYPLPTVGGDEMKDISSALHEAGFGYILWIEPERARAGSEAITLYPELFSSPNAANYYDHWGSLLRLDTEEGYRWMLDLVSNAIIEYDVDIYRQDFNMEPLKYWLDNDERGRIGITEAKYIENLWRLMDELLETFPNLIIDNCASGGRRLDIGMMQRCISLFRTDYGCKTTCNPYGYQYHTQSINRWIPLSTAGLYADMNDYYNVISTLSVGQFISTPVKYAVDVTLENQKYFYGDFYTLLEPVYDSYSHQAWEFYDRDSDSARVTLISRPNTLEGDLTVQLKGLNPEQTYVVTVYGTETIVVEGTGETLMTAGISYYLMPQTAVLLAVEPQN